MGKQTVLLVDDERPVRALAHCILDEDGYEVLQAADGYEALRIASEHRIDLLVTDVAMPGMSGPELICILRDRNFVSRFLLITGYAGDSLHKVHGLYERIPVLVKPFTARELIESVRNALRGATDTVAIGAGGGQAAL